MAGIWQQWEKVPHRTGQYLVAWRSGGAMTARYEGRWIGVPEVFQNPPDFWMELPAMPSLSHD